MYVHNTGISDLYDSHEPSDLRSKLKSQIKLVDIKQQSFIMVSEVLA